MLSVLHAQPGLPVASVTILFLSVRVDRRWLWKRSSLVRLQHRTAMRGMQRGVLGGQPPVRRLRMRATHQQQRGGQWACSVALAFLAAIFVIGCVVGSVSTLRAGLFDFTPRCRLRFASPPSFHRRPSAVGRDAERKQSSAATDDENFKNGLEGGSRPMAIFRRSHTSKKRPLLRLWERPEGSVGQLAAAIQPLQRSGG